MEKPNRVRVTRIELGLGIAELARLSGLSEKTIRDIERARRPGTPVTRMKIVNAFLRLSQNSMGRDDIFPDYEW